MRTFVIVALTFSVAVNLAAAATIGYFFLKPPPDHRPGPGPKEMYGRPPGPDDMHRRPKGEDYENKLGFLSDKLKLSDDQQKQFRNLMKAHAEKEQELRKIVKEKRKELFKEIVKEEPKTELLNQIVHLLLYLLLFPMEILGV